MFLKREEFGWRPGGRVGLRCAAVARDSCSLERSARNLAPAWKNNNLERSRHLLGLVEIVPGGRVEGGWRVGGEQHWKDERGLNDPGQA